MAVYSTFGAICRTLRSARIDGRIHCVLIELSVIVATIGYLDAGGAVADGVPSRPAGRTVAFTDDDDGAGEETRGNKAAAVQRPDERQHYQALTVTGTAVDGNGDPIAGATIFLASPYAPAKPLGKTTSDRDGRFEFRNAQLPVLERSGSFELFGKASGRGFAWSGTCTLHLERLPRARNKQLDFLADDDVEIQLVFAAAIALSGRFIDEAGKPIENVKVQLATCSRLEGPQNDKSRRAHIFRAMPQAAGLMPDQLLATSNSNGRFEFKSVPRDTICSFIIDHPDFGRKSFHVAASDKSETRPEEEKPLVPLPVEMTLKKARTISVRVRSEQTKGPISGARIRAQVDRANGSSSGGTTGAGGAVALKLPPGEYTLTADPPKDTTENLIRTAIPLVVEPVAMRP